MLKTAVFLISFFVFAQLQAQTVFNKTYTSSLVPGQWFDRGGKIVECSAGGYLVAGALGGLPILLKLDAQGDTLWVHKGSMPMYSPISHITQTLDHGFLINYYDANASVLEKIDSAGNIIWTKNYGGPAGPICFVSVIAKPDSSFIAVGTLVYGYHAVICNISSSGAMTGMKVLGDQDGMFLSSTRDGGYILMTEPNNDDFILSKMDSAENITWSKRYSAMECRRAFVKETSDNGFIVGGDFYNGYENICLMKMDSLGNILWSNKYASTMNYSEYEGYATSGGGAVLFFADAPNYGGKSLEIDATGSIVWNKTYSQNKDIYGLSPTADNGYVALFVDPHGFCIIKTDSIGATSCNELPGTCYQSPVSFSAYPITETITTGTFITTPLNQTFSSNLTLTIQPCAVTSVPDIAENENIKLYPNPASENFYVEINLENNFSGTTFLLFDCLGNKVKEEKITKEKTSIQTGNLSPGIYFWQMTGENGMLVTGKISVQK
jgi:hypothetical protein